MSKNLEILIVSKNSNDAKVVTISWNNVDELKDIITKLEKYSEDEYGRFYWEWDEEECTYEENEVLNNY